MRPYSYFACLVIVLAIGCRDTTSKRSSSAKPAQASDARAERVEKQARASAAHSQPIAQAQAVFDEAQREMSAKRYQEALGNYLQLLEIASNRDRAYSGALLSSVLRNLKQLGDVYPTTKTKLIEARDEDETKVKNDDDATQSFNKFAAINSVLGEDQKTVALFKTLDKNNVQAAGEAFEAAQPALIKAGELQLCGTYADPKVYPRFVETYHQLSNLPADSILGENRTEFAQKGFSGSVATLVSLLVLSDRKADAQRIAADAKTVWNDKVFAEALDRALKGDVPAPRSPN